LDALKIGDCVLKIILKPCIFGKFYLCANFKYFRFDVRALKFCDFNPLAKTGKYGARKRYGITANKAQSSQRLVGW